MSRVCPPPSTKTSDDYRKTTEPVVDADQESPAKNLEAKNRRLWLKSLNNTKRPEAPRNSAVETFEHFRRQANDRNRNVTWNMQQQQQQKKKQQEQLEKNKEQK